MAGSRRRSAVVPVNIPPSVPADPHVGAVAERSATSPAMSRDSWTHATDLAPVGASAGAARAFVGVHLRAHGLAVLVDDVRLVVSELASNAVRHAGTSFSVRLRGDGRSLLLTVRDSSPAVVFVRPPGTTSTGGRGLAIVDRLSHDWGVDRADVAAKSVWASFLTP